MFQHNKTKTVRKKHNKLVGKLRPSTHPPYLPDSQSRLSGLNVPIDFSITWTIHNARLAVSQRLKLALADCGKICVFLKNDVSIRSPICFIRFYYTLLRFFSFSKDSPYCFKDIYVLHIQTILF